MTRTETAMALLAALRETQVERVGEFLTDDVEMELPFAPADIPSRVQGRDAVIAALGYLPATFRRFRLAAHEVHDCPSRDAVILEATSLGLLHDERALPYQNRYVFLFRFRDSKICSWREYMNPYPVLELSARASAGQK